MHFVIVFLITALCGRLDAVTTTKINYLPNGQIGGYELIINNTASAQKLRTPGRQPSFKQAHKILKTDSTFSRIDERIEGDNVFVNIQSLITKPKETPRYPVSAVLTVPSVRYNNGMKENVKLTFSKIGPYAALIVPVRNPGESSGIRSDYSIPPEIRNSIKAFIEVSDKPVSKQKYEFSYPPKFSAVGVPGVEPRVGDHGVVGGFSQMSGRVGPYEPPRYEYYDRDVGNSEQSLNHVPGVRTHESIYPGNAASSQIETAQMSKGLIITLSKSKENLTLFAPSPSQHGIDTDNSQEDSSSLQPDAAAGTSPKSGNDFVQNVAHWKVKSPYYYSFSLSEQPPIVGGPVKENKGLRTDRSLASSGSRSNKTTLFLYPSVVSGDIRAEDLGISRERLLGNVHIPTPYAPPAHRNSVEGGTGQSINPQIIPKVIEPKMVYDVTTIGESPSFRPLPPDHHRQASFSQGVPNHNFDSPDTTRDLVQSKLFSATHIQLGADQQVLHQPSLPHDRYAKIFSSYREFGSSTVEHRRSAAGQ